MQWKNPQNNEEIILFYSVFCGFISAKFRYGKSSDKTMVIRLFKQSLAWNLIQRLVYNFEILSLS